MLNGLLGDDYATPDKANGKCYKVSKVLVDQLRKIGVDARVIACNDFLGDASKWHHWYADNGFVVDGAVVTENVGHHVVRVGSAFIDFTARQFFPGAGYPQVYDEDGMNALWGKWWDL